MLSKTERVPESARAFWKVARRRESGAAAAGHHGVRLGQASGRADPPGELPKCFGWRHDELPVKSCGSQGPLLFGERCCENFEAGGEELSARGGERRRASVIGNRPGWYRDRH